MVSLMSSSYQRHVSGVYLAYIYVALGRVCVGGWMVFFEVHFTYLCLLRQQIGRYGSPTQHMYTAGVIIHGQACRTQLIATQ